jgi:hypothetical protein
MLAAVPLCYDLYPRFAKIQVSEGEGFGEGKTTSILVLEIYEKISPPPHSHSRAGDRSLVQSVLNYPLFSGDGYSQSRH